MYSPQEMMQQMKTEHLPQQGREKEYVLMELSKDANRNGELTVDSMKVVITLIVIPSPFLWAIKSTFLYFVLLF